MSATSTVNHWAPLMERLESRQFLSASSHHLHALASSAADGRYTGTDSFDEGLGKQTDSNASATISDSGRKESVTVNDGAKSYVEKGSTDLQPSGSQSIQSVTPLAKHTFLVGVLPQTAGSGVIQVEDGKILTASGTLTPGTLFFPMSFNFSGTKVTTKTAAVPSDAPPRSSVTTLKANPVLGHYKGTLVDGSRGTTYNINVVCSNNKLGHPAIHAQIGIVGFGEVHINTILHAHSTGSFEGVLLGSRPTAGFLNGHITHTGRLVLTLITPGLSVNSGSLKRVSSATSALQLTSTAPADLFASQRKIADSVLDSL